MCVAFCVAFLRRFRCASDGRPGARCVPAEARRVARSCRGDDRREKGAQLLDHHFGLLGAVGRAEALSEHTPLRALVGNRSELLRERSRFRGDLGATLRAGRTDRRGQLVAVEREVTRDPPHVVEVLQAAVRLGAEQHHLKLLRHHGLGRVGEQARSSHR